MTLYSLDACENLIEQYMERGGTATTVSEGTLGLGTVICQAEKCKTAVITERYLNEWTSGHTIRLYREIPKKYEYMVEHADELLEAERDKANAEYETRQRMMNGEAIA